MAIDTTTPRSPGWWLRQGLIELGERQDRLNRLDRYYRGEPDVPGGPPGSKAVVSWLAKKARANWASLIVEAPRERMMPVGFRTGAAGDTLADAEANRIWTANNLPVGSQQLHRSKLSMSDAYTIVGDVDPEIGAPLITVEDPRQVVTFHDPKDRRRVLAAIKVFSDSIEDSDLAYVYLPGWVYRAKRTRASSGEFGWDTGAWEWMDAGQRLKVPVVPVTRFPNRADTFGRTLGEFEDVIDDIDRINLMLLQRTVVAVMQAFRQRAVKGDLPATDEDGEAIDYDNIFRADPGALWRLPEGIDLWESGGVDLTPILSSVKADVQDVMATTRTPMFYVTPDAANGSAEGASLQREGLIFKTKDRITETSDPWERTMWLAFRFNGDESRTDRSQVRVLWQPPEQFSLAERYDAVLKAKAADVPWRTRMTDILQYEPAKVDEMEAQRFAEQLAADAAGVPDAAAG